MKRLENKSVALLALIALLADDAALAQPHAVFVGPQTGRSVSWCAEDATPTPGHPSLHCAAAPERRPRGAQWWCFDDPSGSPTAHIHCAASYGTCHRRRTLVSPHATPPGPCVSVRADRVPRG